MTDKRVFLDANIFIDSLNNESARYMKASAFMEGLGVKEEIGVITSYIINELHYYFFRTDGKKESFNICSSIIKMDRIQIEDILFDKACLVEIMEISRQYNLRTFDAYHAFYCKKLGIKKIATFDKDFKKIPWLEVVS